MQKSQITDIQSVLLERVHFPSIHDAINEIQKLGFETVHGIDMTKNFWRFRQRKPDNTMKKRIKEVSPGIKFILEYPK